MGRKKRKITPKHDEFLAKNLQEHPDFEHNLQCLSKLGFLKKTDAIPFEIEFLLMNSDHAMLRPLLSRLTSDIELNKVAKQTIQHAFYQFNPLLINPLLAEILTTLTVKYGLDKDYPILIKRLTDYFKITYPNIICPYRFIISDMPIQAKINMLQDYENTYLTLKNIHFFEEIPSDIYEKCTLTFSLIGTKALFTHLERLFHEQLLTPDIALQLFAAQKQVNYLALNNEYDKNDEKRQHQYAQLQKKHITAREKLDVIAPYTLIKKLITSGLLALSLNYESLNLTLSNENNTPRKINNADLLTYLIKPEWSEIILSTQNISLFLDNLINLNHQNIPIDALERILTQSVHKDLKLIRCVKAFKALPIEAPIEERISLWRTHLISHEFPEAGAKVFSALFPHVSFAEYLEIFSHPHLKTIEPLISEIPDMCIGEVGKSNLTRLLACPYLDKMVDGVCRFKHLLNKDIPQRQENFEKLLEISNYLFSGEDSSSLSLKRFWQELKPDDLEQSSFEHLTTEILLLAKAHESNTPTIILNTIKKFLLSKLSGLYYFNWFARHPKTPLMDEWDYICFQSIQQKALHLTQLQATQQEISETHVRYGTLALHWLNIWGTHVKNPKILKEILKTERALRKIPAILSRAQPIMQDAIQLNPPHGMFSPKSRVNIKPRALTINTEISNKGPSVS